MLVGSSARSFLGSSARSSTEAASESDQHLSHFDDPVAQRTVLGFREDAAVERPQYMVLRFVCGSDCRRNEVREVLVCGTAAALGDRIAYRFNCAFRLIGESRTLLSRARIVLGCPLRQRPRLLIDQQFLEIRHEATIRCDEQISPI